ncbi:T9SS type A sorting domain-containing protein [Polaribacter sp. R77954]|uniref:T9SS type A sorting domain-containing protein n=1 Tax=Polaribacter sp. R77954 TaxID=3093870 RepID=UPI0037C5DF58
MKKQLLKLTLLALVVFFSASTLQAQALYTVEGTYKISTSGLTENLYMTIDLTNNGGNGPFVVWKKEIEGDHESQLFNILNHRTPADPGLVEITANVDGIGMVTLCTADDSTHPAITLTVKPGAPKSVAFDNSDPDPDLWIYSQDFSGLDQFQRRKAKVNAEGLADATGSNPSAGNNALFIKNTQGGNSRYGVIPAAEGDLVQFDGAGIDVIQYHLVEEAVASVNTFGLNAFTVSNPVNNQLTIKGATNKVQEISLYSVLGNQVLSKRIDNTNKDITLNVNSLSTGLYILKMVGLNGEKFSKKIIKQ